MVGNATAFEVGDLVVLLYWECIVRISLASLGAITCYDNDIEVGGGGSCTMVAEPWWWLQGGCGGGRDSGVHNC